MYFERLLISRAIRRFCVSILNFQFSILNYSFWYRNLFMLFFGVFSNSSW